MIHFCKCLLTLSVFDFCPNCARISLCFSAENNMNADLNRFGASGAFLNWAIVVVVVFGCFPGGFTFCGFLCLGDVDEFVAVVVFLVSLSGSFTIRLLYCASSSAYIVASDIELILLVVSSWFSRMRGFPSLWSIVSYAETCDWILKVDHKPLFGDSLILILCTLFCFVYENLLCCTMKKRFNDTTKTWR